MQDIKAVMKQLKSIRKECGYSVKDVSQYIEQECGENISPKTIYGWESGKACPTVTIFMCLCKCYKINNPLKFFTQDVTEDDEFIKEQLYKSYKSKPDMQLAVNLLLGIK